MPPAVGRVLSQLVTSGDVKLFRGRWDEDDPIELTANDGLRLLHDVQWFRFRRDDPTEERLYYVNVKNIRPIVG